MHQSSYDKMAAFAAEFLAPAKGLRVLDVGSQDVNGSYRPIFEAMGFDYVGMDIAPGTGVDVVVADIANWREIEPGSFDVVVSGQALEHMPYFWLTGLEVARALRPGGLACLIAPSAGPIHSYPVDCYRFYPDGMAALAEYAGLTVLDILHQTEDDGYDEHSAVWRDCRLIARKDPLPLGRRIKRRLLRIANRRLMLSK
jgi:SAM-dependent methyltransferase